MPLMHLVIFGVRNLMVRALVEITRFRSFIVGLSMTILYAERQSMIKKSVITVAWRAESLIVSGSLMRLVDVTASPVKS